MNVEFCKGVIETTPGERIHASWAHTPFGIMAILGGPDAELQIVDAAHIIVSDPVTSLDLPGLDRENLEVIVENILRRQYLDKPGIRDKGEAVLFVLVNEALTEMAGMNDESDDEEGSGTSGQDGGGS